MRLGRILRSGIALDDESWKPIPLDSKAGKPQSLSRTADGQGFYLTSRGTKSFDLLHMTMSGEMHTLFRTDRKQWLINPVPSSDGRYLAFGAQTLDSNVWIIENF
jgi:hypothetical protein